MLSIIIINTNRFIWGSFMKQEVLQKNKSKNKIRVKPSLLKSSKGEQYFNVNKEGDIKKEKSNPNLPDSIYNIIGSRKEARGCSVGVRITENIKNILINLSEETGVSESEIVFRILDEYFTTKI